MLLFDLQLTVFDLLMLLSLTPLQHQPRGKGWSFKNLGTASLLVFVFLEYLWVVIDLPTVHAIVYVLQLMGIEEREFV